MKVPYFLYFYDRGPPRGAAPEMTKLSFASSWSPAPPFFFNMHLAYLVDLGLIFFFKSSVKNSKQIKFRDP